MDQAVSRQDENAMSNADRTDQPPQGFNRQRVVLILACFPLFFTLFMFLPAGTWAWTKGWLFILALLGIISFVFLVLHRVNPEVLIARSRTHKGTKRWDRILLCFFFPTSWAIVPIAALSGQIAVKSSQVITRRSDNTAKLAK